MSIGLEIKKLMSFFNRRKWVVLICMIVFAVAFSANALLKPETKVSTDPNVALNKGKYKDQYFSEFKFYIENKQDGRPISYVGTIKNNLLSDDQLAKIKAAGLDISSEDLKNSIDIYNTNKSADQLFFLVHSKDKELVKELSNYFVEVMKNKDNLFLENKMVLQLSQPSDSIQNWKPDGLVSGTTNAGLTNINQDEKGLAKDSEDSETENKATVTKVSVPQYAVIGLFLGLVLGVFVGIFMDMKSKKIQSMAYLNPIVKEDEKIIDATNFSIDEVNNYLAINAASNQCNSILVLSEKEEYFPIDLKSDLIKFVTALTVSELEKDQMIYIVVKSGLTSTEWLKKEYRLIEGTALSYQVILLS
ncbi:hypothetical protein [Carnobacterium sp. FSL E2-0243]|uniref:hypothetical protein n=1 Tax=Carnobacterium sp. FSL E2-0243 TaxID=2921365 RepID=UPI0030FBAC7E